MVKDRNVDKTVKTKACVEITEFFTKFVSGVEDTKIETLQAMQRNHENSSANVNTAIIDTVLLQTKNEIKYLETLFKKNVLLQT